MRLAQSWLIRLLSIVDLRQLDHVIALHEPSGRSQLTILGAEHVRVSRAVDDVLEDTVAQVIRVERECSIGALMAH